MVGLQAMVLGWLGMNPGSSSKSVCSILPIAIWGPGLYGALAFILVAGRGSCARKRRGVPADVAGAPYIRTQGHRPFYCRWPRCTDSSSLNAAFAFLTPLLAWLRSSYPTSSVSLRFTLLKRCAGASVVRSCPSPVGWARLFPKRSNIFLLFAAPASLIGSELSSLLGSGLYSALGRALWTPPWRGFPFAP